jgi:pimeloyl-ACP methyl ester carboxylesterase
MTTNTACASQYQYFSFLEEFMLRIEKGARGGSAGSSRSNNSGRALLSTVGCTAAVAAVGVVVIQLAIEYRRHGIKSTLSISSSLSTCTSTLDDSELMNDREFETVFGPNLEWTPVSAAEASENTEDNNNNDMKKKDAIAKGPRMITSCNRHVDNVKPTIVLVHGFGCTSFEFKELRHLLTMQGFDIFLYDRIVAVDEDDINPLALPRSGETLAHELHTLLRNRKVIADNDNGNNNDGNDSSTSSRNLSSRIILVGHSYGGLVAQMYAMLYPQQVAGLVLLDPAHELQYDHFPLDFVLSCKIVPFILRFYEAVSKYLPQCAQWLFATMDQYDMFNFPPLFLMPSQSDERKTALHFYCRSESWRRARLEVMGCNDTFQNMCSFRNKHSDSFSSIATPPPMSLVLANNRKYSHTFFPQVVTDAFRDIHMDLLMLHDVELFMADESDNWIHLQSPTLVAKAIASVMQRIENQQKQQQQGDRSWVDIF